MHKQLIVSLSVDNTDYPDWYGQYANPSGDLMMDNGFQTSKVNYLTAGEHTIYLWGIAWNGAAYMYPNPKITAIASQNGNLFDAFLSSGGINKIGNISNITQYNKH